MDKFKEIEKEMRSGGEANAEIPSLVRARLDETYTALAQQPRNVVRINASRRLRKLTLATAAAAVIGLGVFGSAFVSPAMAEALKNMPLVGSLFSAIETDIGLRTAGSLGLTNQVNNAAAYEDVKLEVSESVYDGTRAAFLIHVTAPNVENGIYNNGRKEMKLSSAIENVFFTVDGEAQDEGLNFGSAGEASPNTLVFEHVMKPGEAPDSFNGAVTIKMDGIDHEFIVEIPFRKAAVQAIEAKPDTRASAGDLTFEVSDVSVTPITARLKTAVTLAGAETLTWDEEKRLTRIGIAVYDDQGRRLPALNGKGKIDGNRLVFDRRYATTSGTSTFLTVKPFLIRDDFAEEVEEGQFLKGLETRIELSPAS
ncbi:DUF4179 domain-containing protein [Paenibacillus sp. HJL G12]|uniref:DUF4179 domain-containing protein n=1 Tax=Paenibacillus dendrobii TaxID=2691084 RepID=A0A7X3IEL4_9BACL|nr:DUF4179 domain-containing protein [Paenibacillus dendrobii]MWV42489.1 DUF4179 domain-containing protein [Paenibacillus dendrobii]